jgi:UDP-N-acetylmuramate-alanine ligase
MPGVTSALIAEGMGAPAAKVAVMEMSKDALTTALPSHLQSGDVVLCMGAGDIGRAARDLFGRLAGSAIEEQEVGAKK